MRKRIGKQMTRKGKGGGKEDKRMGQRSIGQDWIIEKNRRRGIRMTRKGRDGKN